MSKRHQFDLLPQDAKVVRGVGGVLLAVLAVVDVLEAVVPTAMPKTK